MDKSDIDKMFMEQAGLFKRLLSDNISEIEKNSKRLAELTIEFYSIHTKVKRLIEFSNVHISISEWHQLSHIPRVGERVNNQKVADVDYRIEGQIQGADVTLEAELRTNQYLSFDEARTLVTSYTSSVYGRSTQFPDGHSQNIYDNGALRRVLGLKPYEKSDEFINADQFNKFFPKLEVTAFDEEQDVLERQSFWKSLLGKL
jgi:hypothetical protein